MYVLLKLKYAYVKKINSVDIEGSCKFDSFPIYIEIYLYTFLNHSSIFAGKMNTQKRHHQAFIKSRIIQKRDQTFGLIALKSKGFILFSSKMQGLYCSSIKFVIYYYFFPCFFADQLYFLLLVISEQ